eukprot:scpid85868/ scgid35263/ 
MCNPVRSGDRMVCAPEDWQQASGSHTDKSDAITLPLRRYMLNTSSAARVHNIVTPTVAVGQRRQVAAYILLMRRLCIMQPLATSNTWKYSTLLHCSTNQDRIQQHGHINTNVC